MKRIALMVLAGVLALSAVDWEVEQVTTDTASVVKNFDPLVVMDNQGYARVLFYRYIEDACTLKVASNATGSWIIENVSAVSDDVFFGGATYSLEVDSKGNTFVIYADEGAPATLDLFLATDSSGEFIIENLTNDAAIQIAPRAHLDLDGVLHVLYLDEVTTEIIQLSYGVIDSEGLHAEQITDNMNQYLAGVGIDLTLEAGGTPHVFYLGYDDYLWHATPSLNMLEVWPSERIPNASGVYPSAAVDGFGGLHLAYQNREDEPDSICYSANRNGMWVKELVTDVGSPDGENSFPCISLDAQVSPHVVWLRPDADWSYDIFYANKTFPGWPEEPVTSTFAQTEYPGFGHYFTIDSKGYGHLVYSANYEKGVWQIYYAKSTEPLSTAIAESTPQVTPLSLEVRGSAVHFSLPASGTIRLDLYDAAGRRMECLASGSYESGEHLIPINSDGLPAGVYFVRLESPTQQVSAKLVVIR
jgi:hypothetical protein